MDWLSFAIASVAGLAVVLGGVPAIDSVLRRIDPEGEGSGQGTPRGGRWIGVLERAWVFVAVLAGSPAALGALVAIKGLGRFGDLKEGDTAFAERFIIGTLLSMGSAAAVGLIVRWLITLL
ncbi:MAG: hypothetical protein L0G23_02420 [Ruaniaceae bacterium]|nr:hypothetical protein [Ruaniaceae bacterium]